MSSATTRAVDESPPSSDVFQPAKENASKSAANLKALLLAAMVLQNTSVVLVIRYTRSSASQDDLYEVNHLILVIECLKFLLSCALEFHHTKGNMWESLNDHVFKRPLDALKILVPALLYVVQNLLLYYALSNLTAPLFQVTYQAKLVTTALISVVMLQRSYTAQQWLCLVALSLGVAIVVLGESKEEAEEEKHMDLFLGLAAVSIASLSSALASVYFEKVLKKPSGEKNAPQEPASLWMRNIQLSFYSVIIAYVQGLLQPGTGKPYLHGFTTAAWVAVALQAGGGLLVAAVIKYADNVLKGLAAAVSVLLSTALSIGLFGTPLTSQFCVGAVAILSAVYVFSNPVQCEKGRQASREVKTLLPS